MQIKIIDLYDRFPFFSYSLFQKYKVETETQPFFKSKKDLYFMLESNYFMEYKSRKKLIKYLEIKDILPFIVLDLSNYHLSDNLTKAILQNFINLENEKINLNFKYIYKYSSKFAIYENFENKINTIKNIEGLDKFDSWVILEMIINLKRYKEFLPLLMNEIKNYSQKISQKQYLEIHGITNKTFIISIHDGSNTNTRRKFLFRKNIKTNNIEVYEYFKTREKKLTEPKWVKFSKENKDIYLDHKFNYLIIDYERNNILFNLITISGEISESLFS